MIRGDTLGNGESSDKPGVDSSADKLGNEKLVGGVTDDSSVLAEEEPAMETKGTEARETGGGKPWL